MNLLQPEQRLDLLRLLDRDRKWYSLDDKRICTVCDRIFTGRQIKFDRDQRGRFRFHCPTPGCSAQIRDWCMWEVPSDQSFQPPLPTGEAVFFTPELSHG